MSNAPAKTYDISFLQQTADQVYHKSIQKLGAKYELIYVNNDEHFYSITTDVRKEVKGCLFWASVSFVKFFSRKRDVTERNKQMLSEYLQLPSVIEEIANLLEPGLEIFDRGKVTQAGREIWNDEFDENMEQLIFNAWDQFLKTFSFVSRSSPHLREFLRASYEAGSFRALSNIEDILEKMDTTIKIVENEEIAIKSSLDEYMEELKSYREWAINFATK